MSTTVQVPVIAAPADSPIVPQMVSPEPQPGRKRSFRRIAIGLFVLAAIAAAVWKISRTIQPITPVASTSIPTTKVKRSDLTLTVSARGALRGGNSEMLTAPLTGGGELHITYLPKPGDLVSGGDVVLEFDRTDQEYKLKEAQSDLAENKLKVVQAEAQTAADTEEAKYLLQKAESDLRVAKFDVRKNPILPAITAHQNDLALQATTDRVDQLRKDLEHRSATNNAAIAVQKAAVAKSEIEVATAQKNIDALTVHAKHPGYVAIRQNQSGNNFFWGMTLPDYQIGDTARAGMAIAEIPDVANWEIAANFGELDRGHLAPGQDVGIEVIAFPGKHFTGKVAELGATGGPPWNRKFETKIRLDRAVPELRPGMSTRIVVTTDILRNALWIPAQALFETGSRTYVFVPNGASFIARDVKLIRRSESQVVIGDLPEGQVVALADPEDENKKKESGSKGPVLPK